MYRAIYQNPYDAYRAQAVHQRNLKQAKAVVDVSEPEEQPHLMSKAKKHEIEEGVISFSFEISCDCANGMAQIVSPRLSGKTQYCWPKCQRLCAKALERTRWVVHPPCEQKSQRTQQHRASIASVGREI